MAKRRADADPDGTPVDRMSTYRSTHNYTFPPLPYSETGSSTGTPTSPGHGGPLGSTTLITNFASTSTASASASTASTATSAHGAFSAHAASTAPSLLTPVFTDFVTTSPTTSTPTDVRIATKRAEARVRLAEEARLVDQAREARNHQFGWTPPSHNMGLKKSGAGECNNTGT
jgi:hypothetical protein